MPEIMDSVTVDGTVTATRFIGPLTGTASRASADASGNGISSTYATKTAVAAKQDALVSGTNIKTINGTSLLGSGDITIGGLSGTVGTDTKPIKVVDGVAVAVTNDLVSTAGNQTIGGLKTFTGQVVNLVDSNGTPPLIIKDPRKTLGVVPSSSPYTSIEFSDVNGAQTGTVGNSMYSDGAVRAYLSIKKDVSNYASLNLQIGNDNQYALTIDGGKNSNYFWHNVVISEIQQYISGVKIFSNGLRVGSEGNNRYSAFYGYDESPTGRSTYMEAVYSNITARLYITINSSNQVTATMMKYDGTYTFNTIGII